MDSTTPHTEVSATHLQKLLESKQATLSEASKRAKAAGDEFYYWRGVGIKVKRQIGDLKHSIALLQGEVCGVQKTLEGFKEKV